MEPGGQSNGGAVFKKSEMLNNFFINKATEIKFIYLKNPCKIDVIIMCHMLTFVKI